MGVFKCINQSQTKRGFTGMKVGEGVGLFFVPFCGFSGLSKLPEFLSSPSVHPSTNLLGSSFLALDFILYLPNLLHICVYNSVPPFNSVIYQWRCLLLLLFFLSQVTVETSCQVLSSQYLRVEPWTLDDVIMNDAPPLCHGRWAAGSSLWLLSLCLLSRGHCCGKCQTKIASYRMEQSPPPDPADPPGLWPRTHKWTDREKSDFTLTITSLHLLYVYFFKFRFLYFKTVKFAGCFYKYKYMF